METPSKKRRVITLEDKKKIIEASGEGKSLGQLVTQFQMGKSTIQTILENKSAILSAIFARFLLRERISAIDDDRQYKINLLHALQFLRRFWDAVKLETLSRCFRKAGLVTSQEPEDDDEAEEENILADMDRVWAQLQANNEVEGTVAEYLAVDEQLETGGALTLAEIAQDVQNKEVEEAEENSDSEVGEIEDEEPSVTAQAANQAMRILQRYADYVTDPAALKHFDALDDFLAKKRFKKMEQKKIDDYFV